MSRPTARLCLYWRPSVSCKSSKAHRVLLKLEKLHVHCATVSSPLSSGLTGAMLEDLRDLRHCANAILNESVSESDVFRFWTYVIYAADALSVHAWISSSSSLLLLVTLPGCISCMSSTSEKRLSCLTFWEKPTTGEWMWYWTHSLASFCTHLGDVSPCMERNKPSLTAARRWYLALNLLNVSVSSRTRAECRESMSTAGGCARRNSLKLNKPNNKITIISESYS